MEPIKRLAMERDPESPYLLLRFGVSQCTRGADRHTGGHLPARAEVAFQGNRVIFPLPGNGHDGPVGTSHHAAPAAHAPIRIAAYDAGIRIFAQGAADAGLHAIRLIALPTEKLHLVALEGIPQDRDPRFARRANAEFSDRAGRGAQGGPRAELRFGEDPFRHSMPPVPACAGPAASRCRPNPAGRRSGCASRQIFPDLPRAPWYDAG